MEQATFKDDPTFHEVGSADAVLSLSLTGRHELRRFGLESRSLKRSRTLRVLQPRSTDAWHGVYCGARAARTVAHYSKRARTSLRTRGRPTVSARPCVYLEAVARPTIRPTRPRRRHRGALDGAQWAGRARVRSVTARGASTTEAHAGRQLAHGAHGRSLQRGRHRLRQRPRRARRHGMEYQIRGLGEPTRTTSIRRVHRRASHSGMPFPLSGLNGSRKRLIEPQQYHSCSGRKAAAARPVLTPRAGETSSERLLSRPIARV